MEQLIPIPTLHLFPVLDELLVELLSSLSPADWNQPTLAKQWTVKDVAAHLLDGNIRALASLHNYEVPFDGQINNYRELVNYLNDLNAVWVKAMKRSSPQFLIEQLKSTGPKYIDYLNTLDSFGPAKYPVAWAGEEHSLNWFHIAREYTEKWHHQQQIREAVGKTDALMSARLFYPCINTFMYALPYAYRNVSAADETAVNFTIDAKNGGDWSLVKTTGGWRLKPGKLTSNATAHITMQPAIAWQLFTKAIMPHVAASKSIVTGDANLSKGIFNMLAVMA